MGPKKRASDGGDSNGGAEPTPAKQNRTTSDFSSLDFSGAGNFKISTWNVDGLRACIKKGGLEYLDHEKPDVICLQVYKLINADFTLYLEIPASFTYYYRVI